MNRKRIVRISAAESRDYSPVVSRVPGVVTLRVAVTIEPPKLHVHGGTDGHGHERCPTQRRVGCRVVGMTGVDRDLDRRFGFHFFEFGAFDHKTRAGDGLVARARVEIPDARVHVDRVRTSLGPGVLHLEKGRTGIGVRSLGYLRILRRPTLPEFRDADAKRRRRGEEIAPVPTHTRATDERHALVIARGDTERPQLTGGGHAVKTGPDRDGLFGGVNPSARFHHSRRRVNQRRVPERDDDPHAPQLSLRGHDVAALGVD